MARKITFLLYHMIRMTREERRASLNNALSGERQLTKEELERAEELAALKMLVESLGGTYVTGSALAYEDYGDEHEILQCDMLIIDDGGERGKEWYLQQAQMAGIHRVCTLRPDRWEDPSIVHTPNWARLVSDVKNALMASEMIKAVTKITDVTFTKVEDSELALLTKETVGQA